MEALWDIEKPPAQTLMPTLLEFKDEKSEVARPRCNVIGQFGQVLGGRRAWLLAKALNDKDPTVRAEAAMALAEIGPAAKGAVGALLETLKPAKEVSFAELLVLTAPRQDRRTRSAGPERVLHAPEYRSAAAVYALAMIGPQAADTIEPLGKCRRAEADRAAWPLGRWARSARTPNLWRPRSANC